MTALLNTANLLKPWEETPRSSAHEIQIAIGLCDTEGLPTGSGATPSSYAEHSFRFRMTNRDPKTKMELIDTFLRTHEEIERLHIENASAPWFPTYMSNKLANTASTFNPALPRPAPVARSRTRVTSYPTAPPSDSIARINEAIGMNGQAPLGSYEASYMQAPLIESPASATVLADIATLQETVRSHGARTTGLETTLAAGFDSMLRRIDQKFESATISPVRSSGPPRRSFGPRRNLQDVTCYACGQKGHYARDCKGASFSSLPANKQNEITGALNNAPLGDFTMAVVWEQFAPTNTSQSLDESLDNLHHWAMGAPLSPADTQKILGLTAAPQVELVPAPIPPLLCRCQRCPHLLADLRLLGYAPPGSYPFVLTLSHPS